MARRPREIRDGRLYCPGCVRWVPATSEKWRRWRQSRYGAVSTNWTYAPRCKDCELRDRVNAKITDPAAYVEKTFKRRASEFATSLRKAGIPMTTHQVLCGRWECQECQGCGLAWERMIPWAVAGATQGLPCPSCGEPFSVDHLENMQIEHIWPPRPEQFPDFPRHCARALRFLDNCNGKKQAQDPESWVDREWEAQQSEYHHQQAIQEPPQDTLFPVDQCM